ncbi:MAG: energy-coupling factor transporter transmembrane component T family protein [Lachnospiraceae bacterium]|jgi:energy-coupling factor transport system permease protein
MFRDITIGQYYPANSILHRLDPRVKLLGVLVYISALFIVNNIWGCIFLMTALVLIIIISRIPLSYILRGMRMIVFLIIVAVFFNLFFTEGNILWQWWIFKLTEEGIIRAAFFALRLVFVIMGSSMLTYTTTPTTLTGGFEKALSPLRVIRFPVHEMAMMMSIALRFILVLTEEVNKIIKAQLARGADLETGGLIKRAKGMIPILIPLFVSAFRRAADLATAMEARCYHGGDNRTKMNPLKYERRDIVAFLVLLIYLLLAIGLRICMDNFLEWGRI